MNGPNADQQLLIVERATKARLRKHYTRKFAGFDGISRRVPQDNIVNYCLITAQDFVAAAERKDVTHMRAHKMLCNLNEEGVLLCIATRFSAHEDVCRQWAQEVIDSLHRCGLPFVDDRESMEAARLKANEERARRRELMRERRHT